MEMTLPNILTWLRILMIPVLGLLFLLPAPWANAAAAERPPVSNSHTPL